MTIGEKIKDIRISKKMTMRDLSAISKVGKSTISDIENNKVNPNSSTLDKLANALGVSVNDFFVENSISDILTKEIISKYNLLDDKYKEFILQQIEKLLSIQDNEK